jgi:hypothetical protein
MIDKVRGLFHRRIEPQIFVRVFSIFMSLRRLHAHDDFVRMNLLDRAFLPRAIDEDPIAGFQHAWFLSR